MLLLGSCAKLSTVDQINSPASVPEITVPVQITTAPLVPTQPIETEYTPAATQTSSSPINLTGANWLVQVPAPNEVWLWGGEYRPSTLVVKAGTTVTWIGKDAEGHDVESEAPSLFHASVAPGTSFNWTFETPGVYPYHCCCGLLDGVIIVK